MYKKVAPTVKEKTTIIVPNHLPNKKPPTRNIGLPNPSRTIQIIVNKIKSMLSRIKFEFLKKYILSMLFFINS
jgi:hypothetical protein